MATLNAPVAVQTPPSSIFQGVHHVSSFSSQQTSLSSSQPFATTLSSRETPSHPAPAGSKTRSSTTHSRWRPRFHLMPSTGWLNDPCAPGYDRVHDVYHVGFQWNPKAPEWGDIAWGSATSKDMLFWETASTPSIDPSSKLDGEAGVFTGCMSPATTKPGTSTAFYTSARILPIHHTLPYNWGAEAICVANSADAGRTWQRASEATVVQGPPADLQVTGWRDPFVATWPSLARLLGDKADTDLFGIVSGGLRGEGPAVFLYALDTSNLAAWSFLSVLTPALPSSDIIRRSPWTPDYGVNWEVVNFLSLPDPDDPASSYEILVVGVEGREKSQAKAEDRLTHTEFRRDHSQMWLCGKLAKTSGVVQMQFRSGGALDYGALYAANSFHDPKTAQQVVFGWIVEEDLPTELKELQGWAGSLSIPRVIKLQRVHRVVRALKSDLQSISSIEVQRETNRPDDEALSPNQCGEMYSITTLSAVPDPRLQSLRHAKRALGPGAYHSSSGSFDSLNLPMRCVSWEADMSFSLGGDEVDAIGFVITHSHDSELYTTVSFNPNEETLRVERANSTRVEGVCVADEVAPHTLFSTLPEKSNPTSENPMAQEPLRLHIFFDVSSLELFANERTAITARVYPDTTDAMSIRPFVTLKDGYQWSGELLECSAWELRTSRT